MSLLLLALAVAIGMLLAYGVLFAIGLNKRFIKFMVKRMLKATAELSDVGYGLELDFTKPELEKVRT
jgi:hypothetical protein